jgi:TRAP-type mannitol/chloroaromatic compound transport system permease small subunit
METLGKVLRFIDAMSEWTGKAASYLITVLAFMVGFEVVARYFFNHPTEWGPELSAMVFGTFAILGGAYVLRMDGHVSMDIVYQLIRPRPRALLDLCTAVLSFSFVGVLLWKGGESAWVSIRTLEHASTMWGPPLYPVKSMLPVGAFLLLLQLVNKFIRDVITLIRGQGEEVRQ